MPALTRARKKAAAGQLPENSAGSDTIDPAGGGARDQQRERDREQQVGGAVRESAAAGVAAYVRDFAARQAQKDALAAQRVLSLELAVGKQATLIAELQQRPWRRRHAQSSSTGSR